MSDQAKRGIAAIMIAGGIVTCVGLLIVARLAPATMSATAWFIVLGIILSDLAIALWLLRTSKD